MNLTEKRSIERQQSKDKRRAEIIEAAKVIFDQQGIESTRMVDVAEIAEVGVATVYRYFKTKSELVIAVGIEYCHEVLNDFDHSRVDSGETGIEGISKLLDELIDMYYKFPQFIRFLQHFDFFFQIPDNRTADMEKIENELSRFYPYVFNNIDKGMKDGSIKAGIDSFNTGVTIFRTFITMEQRILTRDHTIKIDEQINPDQQLLILKDMIVNYLGT